MGMVPLLTLVEMDIDTKYELEAPKKGNGHWCENLLGISGVQLIWYLMPLEIFILHPK